MRVPTSAAAAALVALAVAATAGTALAREDEDGTPSTQKPAAAHRHGGRMGEMHEQMQQRMGAARSQGGHRHEGLEGHDHRAGHGRGEGHGDGCPMHAEPKAATR